MKILTHPHPALSYPCKPLRKINQQVRDIAAEMLELMYTHEGVGLAANQVGLPYQLFVMNASADPMKKEEEYVFINPVIRKKKGQIEDLEGCLSFPELQININRAELVEFQAITLEGQVVEFIWKGFPARVVQHETDHLLGYSFYQRAGLVGTLKVKEALQTMQEIYESDMERGFVPSAEQFKLQIEQQELG